MKRLNIDLDERSYDIFDKKKILPEKKIKMTQDQEKLFGINKLNNKNL